MKLIIGIFLLFCALVFASCDFGAADEWPSGVVVTDSSNVSISDSLNSR